MATGSFQFALAGFGGAVGPELFYAFTSASAQRKGLFVSAISGSPPLSLGPRSGSPDFLLEGDIWYQESGSTGDGNLFIAEKSVAEGIIFAQRFVTSRENETTVEQVVSRFTSSDAPNFLRVGANAVVIDNFYVTVNTASLSGSLVRNASWTGGIFMPDVDTVAVFGEKDFLVPSGSTIVERGNFTIQSGSITINSGNILLQGDSSSFNISGSSISASIQGFPIVSVLTGSISSESLSPVPGDGTVYINTASGDISIFASGGVGFLMDIKVPAVIDGGTY